MRICLLGASFDTGNLGVSALAESSIKVILNRWPDAEVAVLSGRVEDEYKLKLFGREVSVERVPLRFCKNVFLPNHYCRRPDHGTECGRFGLDYLPDQNGKVRQLNIPALQRIF